MSSCYQALLMFTLNYSPIHRWQLHLTSETSGHFTWACWCVQSGRILGSELPVSSQAVGPLLWVAVFRLSGESWNAASWMRTATPNLCQSPSHSSRDLYGPGACVCALTSQLAQRPKTYTFSVNSWFHCLEKLACFLCAFGNDETAILGGIRWWTSWSQFLFLLLWLRCSPELLPWPALILLFIVGVQSEKCNLSTAHLKSLGDLHTPDISMLPLPVQI